MLTLLIVAGLAEVQAQSRLASGVGPDGVVQRRGLAAGELKRPRGIPSCPVRPRNLSLDRLYRQPAQVVLRPTRGTLMPIMLANLLSHTVVHEQI